MKTIAISVLGWAEDEVRAFVSYVEEVSSDFGSELVISITDDQYLEILVEENFILLQNLILSSQPS